MQFIHDSTYQIFNEYPNCLKKIELINDKSRFTVVRCHQRGVLNDMSLIAYLKINNSNVGNNATNYNTNKEYIQFESGEVS